MHSYDVLGMMSGTSLDGLDLAHCQLRYQDGQWSFTIKKTADVSYSKHWKSLLKDAIHLSDKEHATLHLEYGKWLGEQAFEFLKKNDIAVDFIASHGHTSHHRPEEGFTFQLGDGQQLANSSGQKVICDFRTMDVGLGGQGAPLVPIGDELLFGKYDFCLNLGGISNISFKKDGHRIAYDIGMANMPLNHIVRQLGMEYDENGNLAKEGQLDPRLLKNLNDLEYYKLPYPKSTGYEWFLEKVCPILEASEVRPQDILHTLIHHNCVQIATAVTKNSTKPNNALMVCGGGALNTFFMEVLKEKLGKSCELVIPNKELISYKEALVFALMGVLRERDEINILKSVTGASKNSSSGVIFHPTR